MLENTHIISSSKNPVIAMAVSPGHFATSSSHISHYLNMIEMKTNALAARDVAREMGVPFLTSSLVDTIVCMEGTEIIGAFLAQELLQDGTMVMNSDGEIHVVTPKNNTNGQLVFPRNVYPFLADKNVVLLVASVSSGTTIHRARECITYYGGKLTGICAIFSAVPSVEDIPIYSVFTADDVPDYYLSSAANCPMCARGRKLDAIITAHGYHEL